MNDILKQCQCCVNYISANYFDEEPWCRIKPYHQMPKTKPGETRCKYFTSPVFVCKFDEGGDNMIEREVCGTCKYNKQTYDGHCNAAIWCENEESDYYAVPSFYDDTCEKWEKKDE